MSEEYGEQIKSYRINLGLTQSQVAMELEYSALGQNGSKKAFGKLRRP